MTQWRGGRQKDTRALRGGRVLTARRVFAARPATGDRRPAAGRLGPSPSIPADHQPPHAAGAIGVTRYTSECNPVLNTRNILATLVGWVGE